MSTDARGYGDPATRRRILDASWELLERREAVTMASVAKRAGVSRQGVYLHFGDRSMLLVALVDHIDISLGRDKIRAYVHDESATGVERLRRWVETMAWYTEKIDRVTAILESGADEDAALAAAWRDRMNGRRDHLRRIMTRIDEEGALLDGWSVDDAVSLAHAVTMPGPWRELRNVSGWDAKQYRDHVWKLLARGLLGHTESLDTLSSDA